MYLGDAFDDAYDFTPGPQPGTPEFGQQAAARRAAIYGAPLPPTNGPAWYELPAKAIGTAAKGALVAAADAATGGVGVGALLVGAGLGLWLLTRRR